MDHLISIGQVITVEDWSEIQVLARREGLSQREMENEVLRRAGVYLGRGINPK